MHETRPTNQQTIRKEISKERGVCNHCKGLYPITSTGNLQKHKDCPIDKPYIAYSRDHKVIQKAIHCIGCYDEGFVYNQHNNTYSECPLCKIKEAIA